MADAQLKLSRRALRGAACAVPLATAPRSFVPSEVEGRYSSDDGNMSFVVTNWDRAVAALKKAAAALAAASRT